MKKILFSVLLTAALAAPVVAKASKDDLNKVENYAAAQSAVPEGGYVLVLYADGWDKFSKKTAQKMLKSKEMKKALNGCAVIEYAVPNFSSETTNNKRADKLGKLKWVAPNSYPAFVLYDKDGRHYATVPVLYSERSDTDAIATRIEAAREALRKQTELLEDAKGAQGLARALLLGKSTLFDNISLPENIINLIKAADPEDKTGHARRLSFNAHNFAESSAKTKDWRATLKDVEERLEDESYSVAQRQGMYAIAVGLLRRHGDLNDQKKMVRYLRAMKKLDPTSPLGRSADHAEALWFSSLSIAEGWSPGVLPKNQEPAEIEGPLPIKGAGTYEVTFTYNRGSHQLVVKGVQLYDGPNKVAEDMHIGTAGIKHSNNVYTLRVDSRVKSPRLKAVFDMPQNRDSYGTITVKKK